jgi:hypothetical protein
MHLSLKSLTPALALMVFPAASLLLNACVFGSEQEKNPTAPATGPCVDVSGETLKKADSLVGMANDLMVSNFQYWSDQDGKWEQIKRRNPQAALDYYDKALQVAPGHCQAIFGRAVASATLLTQDPKMDDFIQKVDNSGPAPGASAKLGSMAGLMKMPPDQAAPALLKASATLRVMDRPTVREAQQLIEQVIMPKLDSTIAAMETVMDYSMFAIRFYVDKDSLEIDRSEVGPGLAGLKVMKAFLTVVAGYEWEVALDGKYDWFDTLGQIQQDEFDHLRPGQIQALDHYTGLFAQSSPISKFRSGWREKVQGIPALLLGAVGDAQKGLQSTIEEARSGKGQEYDPWRAGGVNADVDTADLRITIEALERSKKYLQGEVPISYAKGSHVLKVNFPRLFQIDGLQGMLPYFKFLPYSQWNDTVTSDTTWSVDGYTYFTYDAQMEALRALGLGNRNLGGEWDMYASYSPNFSDTGSVLYYGNLNQNWNPRTPIAEFWPDAEDPCSFAYVKHFEMVGSPADSGIQWAPHESQGRFRISLCREAAGQTEFATLEVRVRGPIEFTDAAGATTLTFSQLAKVDEPQELAGKIVFRDPTFGGIFPELTNANLWENVQSVKGTDTRTQRVCAYERDPASGYERWKCSRVLADNPSDLDYLVYALYWWDDIN